LKLETRPLLNWYRRNRRDLPWRKTRDPYAIFVSEVMLQQTQVKTVLPYYNRWMAQYPTPQSLASASENEVLKAWEGLGYYRRSRLLHTAAKVIVEKFHGKFPNSLNDIATLPGVGRYTLGAVASIAFNLPLPILDGNVTRVLCRWFGVRGNIRQTSIQKRLWKLAKTLIPKGAAGDFNQSLMELGATICLPHKPLCLLCPIRKGCWALAHNKQEQLPSPASRTETIKQFEYAGLVLHKGQILLYQRRKGERMESLWQFPSVTFSKPVSQWTTYWKKSFGSFQDSVRLHRLNYSVTHHRICLELFEIHQFDYHPTSATQWVSLVTARDLVFPAAHRKLADRFLK